MSSFIDISIGKYYHNNSVIHQLDPRAKILSLASLLISLSITKSLLLLIIVTFLIAITFFLSKIRFFLLFRYIQTILFLLLSVFLLQLLFDNSGSKAIFSIGPINIKYQGLYNGFIICYRFLLIAIYSAILVITTIPTRLAEGISYLLRPLKTLRVPIDQIPIMVVLTLKFIPTLFAEGEKLISSQKLRGSQFESRNPIKRIQIMSALIMPLLRNCFRMADELAIGIESRCYHNGIKTNLYEMRFIKTDYIVIIISFIINTLSIILLLP